MRPGTLVSRLAAFALLGLAIYLAVAVTVLPVLDRHAALDAEIARSSDAIGRYRAEIGRLEALRARQEATGPTDVGEGGLTQGTSEAAAGARIQQRIKAAFERHGETLERVQFLPARQEGPVHKLGLRFSTTAPLRAVQAALHELETRKPFLVVESLEARRKVRPAEGAEQEQERDLVVEISLFGLWPASL